ncbi:hypothetical protein NHQ30_011469 [Ciborinia camelliae]|nr:hypothetical protein NHQ30_011469 [Ciborinia camelliae]
MPPNSPPAPAPNSTISPMSPSTPVFPRPPAIASWDSKLSASTFSTPAARPLFDLASVSKILYAAKTGDVAAPVTANRGPADTGAVDWLSLVAKVSYTSVGLTQVYRVETAGGNSINPCSTAGVESVQYAAQYWFYS